MNLRYLFGSGKNPKWKYYLEEYLLYATPRFFFCRQLNKKLLDIDKREDKTYIAKRVSYYNKLTKTLSLPSNSRTIKNYSKKSSKGASVYFFDTHRYLSWFDSNYRFIVEPGDVTFIPEHPALVKSRPISGANANSVMLNLDIVRHFIFVQDKLSFRDKKDLILFRGETQGKPHRQQFLKMYFNHPMCNLGDVKVKDSNMKPFEREILTIPQHLKYKFIMALEGNDVASNLKWVMSSNSLAVMPRPVYETWFMEGTLKPDYHYIEIKADYSDLIEKCTYYILHPDEAELIIQHAHEYVKQFQNKPREKLISLLVLEKYFVKTGQMSPVSQLDNS